MEDLKRHNIGGEFRGDFTRHTFDPHKHFMRVLMQQGRVQLDSDWNEQTAILLHYIQTLATDLIGPHGGPADRCGFEIIGLASGPPGNLSENEKRQLAERLDELNHGDFLIGRGHYYVDGMLCENGYYVPYTKQPDLPDLVELEGGNRYLVYLDVWERHITSNEDESIREVALGGADTATRSVLTWHVKVSELQEKDDAKYCDELLRNILATLRQPGQSKLSARTRSDQRTDDHCVIPPESRYRGTENQLYRIEIHKSGAATKREATGDYQRGKRSYGTDAQGATFRWSRDNGSVIFPIVSLGGDTVEVKHLGRASSRTLKPDDWVEIVDDSLAKRGSPGPLFQVGRVDPLDLTVRLRIPQGVDPPPSYTENSDSHPLLRRWDSPGAIDVTVSNSGGGIILEDGIEITFHEENGFRAGDYWLIPARTATGNIEWPQEGALPDQEPKAMPPHGVTHHYAPLATVRVQYGALRC